jgi:general secretion pathway protein D
LIEATIVEVTLSDRYQAGIDWNLIQTNSSGQTELIGSQFLTDNALIDPVFSITHIGDDLAVALKALSSFGDISVMSSPKIMALNNQTALLKVVDNLVYFTVDVTVENGTEGSPALYTYETDINTVPVGFVMSVTPYINEFDNVTLNIRPTISRVIGQARDPNPALVLGGVISEIPVIQVREVESILKIPNGEIAVIGGLMQDEKDNSNNSVPMASKIPFLGKLFSYEDKLVKKSELVILIKPVVIKSKQDLNISSRSPGSEAFR